MEYADFELQIGPRTGDDLLVRVLRSPAGEGECLVRWDRLFPIQAVRDLQNPRQTAPLTPAEIGGRLFRALFQAEVGALFLQSLSHSGATEQGLRIRLRINPRDTSVSPLQSLPWELLYRAETEDFLALSSSTPVVRSLEIPRRSVLKPFRPPLRVLLVPSPDEDSRLNLEREIEQLREALRRDPGIEVEVLARPDIGELRGVLGSKTFHVLHFMGHGTFNSQSGEGELSFGSPTSPRTLVSGRHLATVVKDFGSLRLVVLNACSTARSGSKAGQSPFAGVATALVLGGVPAVVAMQSPIRDTDAIAFSSAFYGRLALGRPIEEAITEGRQAIYSLGPKGEHWSIPVLFLRPSSDGLFAFQERRTLRRLWPAAAALLLLVPAAALVLRDQDFRKPESKLPEPELREVVQGTVAETKESALPQLEPEHATTTSDEAVEPPEPNPSPAATTPGERPSVSSPEDVKKKPLEPFPIAPALLSETYTLEESTPLRLPKIGVTLSVQFFEVQGVGGATLTIVTKEGTRREPNLNPGREFLVSSDSRPVRVIVHGIQESEKILTLEVTSP